jgi:hypothetical protein
VPNVRLKPDTTYDPAPGAREIFVVAANSLLTAAKHALSRVKTTLSP